MTHPYVWHGKFLRVPWLMHTCDMTHSRGWHDPCIRVIWLAHTCDMTPAYVWLDSFICVTWLMHMCDMTLHVTCLIHMCDMTHSYISHNLFTCGKTSKNAKDKDAMHLVFTLHCAEFTIVFPEQEVSMWYDKKYTAKPPKMPTTREVMRVVSTPHWGGMPTTSANAIASGTFWLFCIWMSRRTHRDMQR